MDKAIVNWSVLVENESIDGGERPYRLGNRSALNPFRHTVILQQLPTTLAKQICREIGVYFVSIFKPMITCHAKCKSPTSMYKELPGNEPTCPRKQWTEP